MNQSSSNQSGGSRRQNEDTHNSSRAPEYVVIDDDDEIEIETVVIHTKGTKTRGGAAGSGNTSTLNRKREARRRQGESRQPNQQQGESRQPNQKQGESRQSNQQQGESHQSNQQQDAEFIPFSAIKKEDPDDRRKRAKSPSMLCAYSRDLFSDEETASTSTGSSKRSRITLVEDLEKQMSELQRKLDEANLEIAKKNFVIHSYELQEGLKPILSDKEVQTILVGQVVSASERDKHTTRPRTEEPGNTESITVQEQYRHFFEKQLDKTKNAPTVLAKVFEYLEMPDLTICRQVCTVWRKTASRKLRDKIFLHPPDKVCQTRNSEDTRKFLKSAKKSYLYPASGYKFKISPLLLNGIFSKSYLETEKLNVTRMKLDAPTSNVDIKLVKLRDFLPSSLPHLKYLELNFPCTLLSTPKITDDYDSEALSDDLDEDFGIVLPTRLKQLKINCICTNSNVPTHFRFHKTHFENGLLLQLLKHSPELQRFEFIEEPNPIAPNKNLVRQLADLLNEIALNDLKHLTIVSPHKLQDLQIVEFMPRSKLRSVNISGILWKQVKRIWFHHKTTLETLVIGDIDDSIDTTQISQIVFEKVTELILEKTCDVRLLQDFTKKCFPNLKKLSLFNPEEDVILFIWKELVQLQELRFEFSAVHERQKYKWLHLDSLFSGFSISECEGVLENIRKTGIPNNFKFEAVPDFIPAYSVQHVRSLQKLVIKSTNFTPYRITEVSLILVLLRMKSLTSITIEGCQLLDGTLEFLKKHVSPAIYLRIVPPGNDPSYVTAKRSLIC